MRSDSLQTQLASCAMAGAAAKLAATLVSARPAWRTRALSFLHDATRLGDDVAALRYLHAGPLRRAHVQRLVADTRNALAAAMQLHNLLSISETARAAAFDGAAQASALILALAAEESSINGASRGHDRARNRT